MPFRRCGPGLDAASVGWTVLGQAGGDRLIVEGLLDVAIAAAVAAWRDSLPQALAVD